MKCATLSRPGSEPAPKRRPAELHPVTGLRIGATDDPHEREADRVAREVLSGGETKRHWSLASLNSGESLQRKCSCGSSGGSDFAPPIVREVLNSPGQPLPQATRKFFEPRFGHDFSSVRLHADSRAAASARAVGALAYTVGNDIAFGYDQYSPQSARGRRLLAHELTHTIQQRPVTDRLQRQIEGEDTEVDEQDANEVHDGDTPVNTSAALAVNEPPGAQLDEIDSSQEAVPMQAGGQKTQAPPSKKDDKHKKSAPAKKITSIDVDLSTQTMTVHYDDGTTEGHGIASGKGRRGTDDDPCKTQTEKGCTPTGDFQVVSKGDANTKNSEGDGMAWYVELGGDKVIDGRGIGIHDSQPIGGGPRSHGCVRVGNSEKDKEFAKKINKGVDDKTTVHITGKAATKPWGKKAPPAKAAKPQSRKPKE